MKTKTGWHENLTDSYLAISMYCDLSAQHSNEASNFYWDRITASFKIKDANEVTLQKHQRFQVLYEVLDMACDLKNSGIGFHSVTIAPSTMMGFGYTFDLDYPFANEIANVVDCLAENESQQSGLRLLGKLLQEMRRNQDQISLKKTSIN